jgi:membrane protein DedA with SNARE-associated domain
MSDKPKSNVFIQFLGLGLQMFVTIYAGHYLGEKLDQKFMSEGLWYSKGLTLLAVILSTILVIRQVQNISK